MLCLMTLADVEAVSPETLTPWKEELLWRLYVDTYNHLTQRYGDELIERSQAGVDDLLAQLPAGPRSAARSRASSRDCRSGTCSSSRATRSIATSGCAREIQPDEVHLSLERAGFGVDAGRRHARQAVSVLEHLRRAVVVRHEHHARPRADEPERARARRLPVHRRRAVPRAEQRRARSGVLHVLEDVVAGREELAPHGCAAASAARCGANGHAVPAGRSRRQRGVEPLHDSRYRRRRMRSGCCIASAASSRSTAATSTWC